MGASLLPGLALAGGIKGKVSGAEKLLNPVWNEAKDPANHRYSFREPSPTVRGEFRVLYGYAPKELCIAALGTTAATVPDKPLLFKLGGGRTNPVTLVVAPGTTLEVLNNDPFLHRPYLVGNPTFEANDLKSKGPRQWKVPASAAVYEMRDELSPSVRSWVVAEPNVAGVAFPQRDSTFAFDHLPAGDYTLQAYYSGKRVGVAKPVTIKGDAVFELKDVLPVADVNDKTPGKE